MENEFRGIKIEAEWSKIGIKSWPMLSLTSMGNIDYFLTLDNALISII